jgi:regulatory protein
MSRRRPKKPTPAYLERVALWYLERWFTTRSHLRRKLIERVDRGLAEHGGDREEALAGLDGVLDKLEDARILDDWLYVRGRVGVLRRRGSSERAVHAKLRAKGASRDMVERALAELRDEEGGGELLAACRYVRRRRLGPFRTSVRDDQQRKDLARLARQGFSFDIARRALAMSREDLEELVFAAR